MKAGRLRHRIRVEQPVNGLDATGAPQKTWQAVGEVSAEIRSVSGREYLAAGRDIGDELYRINIREIPGIHLGPDFRAIDIDTGAEYSITAVLDNHVRNMLTLVARAGGPHG